MDQPFLLAWRRAVVSDAGPASPTTRHVLLTLSVWMNADGGECFPSTRTLEGATKLARRSVLTHLAAAERDGWIVRKERGDGGQGWRRNQYQAVMPKVVNGGNHVEGQGGERGSPRRAEGGERSAPKVVKEVHLKSPVKSPITDMSHFDEAWSVYPKRPNNSKAAARKAWGARVKAGVDPARMLDGVRRYAAYIEETGTEPRFVKLASTFFGPGEHFDNDFGGADDEASTATDLVWDEARMGAFR